jgi:lantibiotic biosynthesis protein
MDTVDIYKPTLKEKAHQKIEIINNVLNKHAAYHHGFLGGSLGLLYYYFNAYKALHTPDLLQKAEDLLAIVFEDINETGKGLAGVSLSNGAAGFAFTMNYLQQEGLIDFDVDTELVEMDEFLFNSATELLRKEEIDYLHGALGVLFYFTNRIKPPKKIQAYINSLVEQVCSLAISDKNGIWFKNFSIERLKNNETADLGLAHGLCGILLILMKALPFVNDAKLLKKIIRSGISFILSNQLPDVSGEEEFSLFAASVNTSTNNVLSLNRLAWCYGDINETLLLYRAGNLFLDASYTTKADSVGFKTIERNTAEATLCTDSHFCHGTAGLAQFYFALYNESGHYSYYKAYEYWIEKTIALIDTEIETNAYASNPVGLLEGWSGVALVLTEYVNDGVVMNWPKAFLL